MQVWVTKYVMSRGIIEATAEVTTTSPTLIRAKFSGETGTTYLLHKPYWHETLESAKAHAETLRTQKVASLRRQLDKIEKMVF